LTLAAVVALTAGCGGARYHSTRGARLVDFTVHSRLTHRDLHEILVEPRRHGSWLLVLLHGKGGGPSQFLSRPFFKTLAALRNRAPDVLLLDGGDDSYWHNRADGAWESIPGFCAVGAQSPALWPSAGQTAPGAFDNAQDYERNNVFELRPPHPLWIDLGASDPFREATLAYARRAAVRAHIKPGGHDLALWNAYMPKFLRFFVGACA
jgi:hypothetical protein